MKYNHEIRSSELTMCPYHETLLFQKTAHETDHWVAQKKHFKNVTQLLLWRIFFKRLKMTITCIVVTVILVMVVIVKVDSPYTELNKCQVLLCFTLNSHLRLKATCKIGPLTISLYRQSYWDTENLTSQSHIAFFKSSILKWSIQLQKLWLWSLPLYNTACEKKKWLT